MKTPRILLFSALLFAVSCAGQVAVPPDSGSTAQAGGGGAGGATTCDALVADLAERIALARACTTVGTWDECDWSVTVPDECGCHAPLNHVEAALVSSAQAASAAVVEAGCTRACAPEECAARYNDPGYHGGCTESAPGEALCTWTGAS